jgi:hypothetical protein
MFLFEIVKFYMGCMGFMGGAMGSMGGFMAPPMGNMGGDMGDASNRAHDGTTTDVDPDDGDKSNDARREIML